MEEQIQVDQEKTENPISEVENLKNYIQNSDKTKIVEFICKLNKEQRLKLKETYVASYGTELIKDLEKVLSGNVEKLVCGLIKSFIDFDAEQIYLSMKGLGTDEDTLSEMIATKPSRHLNKIKQRYPELYNETLENDIKGDTSDYYRNILIAMIQGGRSDNPYPNSQKMKDIVNKLNDDNENIFNIFCEGNKDGFSLTKLAKTAKELGDDVTANKMMKLIEQAKLFNKEITLDEFQDILNDDYDNDNNIKSSNESEDFEEKENSNLKLKKEEEDKKTISSKNEDPKENEADKTNKRYHRRYRDTKNKSENNDKVNNNNKYKGQTKYRKNK